MSLLDTASLIVTPNGYKEGKLYSVIPSDGSGDMSVTRATTATRVNSAGLVELVPYNLLRWSEDLTQWTANAQIATTQLVFNPLTGKNNATKITKVTSAGDPWVVQTNAAGDGTYTYSFYLWTDAGQPTDVTLFLYNSAVSEVYTLAITLTTTPTRYEYTSTFASTGGAINARVDLSATATNQYIYAYAGQLVEGSVAKPYLKTETRLNIPRLDYSNGTCPSLLVEPQRTNLALYSSSFDNAAWSKNELTVTTNGFVSPSGIQDADKIIPNTVNTFHTVQQVINVSSGSNYTFSTYAKASGYNYVVFNTGGSTGGNSGPIVNLSNGTIAGYFGSTDYNAVVEDAGNGWYKISFKFTTNSTSANVDINIFPTSTVASYSGDGTSGCIFWGYQFELGSYPTSYIPTTSASVTRNADVISKTSFASAANAKTWFADADLTYLQIDGSNSSMVLTIRSGSYEGYFRYFVNNDLSFQYTNPTSPVNIVLNNAIPVNTTKRLKMAARLENNNFAFYVNGVLIGTNVVSTRATGLDILEIGNYANIAQYQLSGGINAIALWDEALTNTQLAQLTAI